MNSKHNDINICLYKLSDKDQAAVERVVQFSASQGKRYVFWGELVGADIVVASGSEGLGDLPAIVIRVGDQAEELGGLVLQPPLLVSRVMRVIDKAASMLASSPAEIKPGEQAGQSTVAEKNIEPKDKAETKDKITSAEKFQTAVEMLQAKDDAVDKVEIEGIEKPKTDSESGTTEKSGTIEALKPNTRAWHVAGNKAENTLEVEEKPAEKAESKPDVEEDSGQFIALVVDDSAAIRKQLELELRTAKIKVDFAETGEEALEKSAQKDYDLVFLDIVMPGIDGYEVCKQMRLRELMKKTPIIMLSGKTSPLDEVQGVIAGASTYLTKPVKHEMFQKTLSRLSNWLSDYNN